MFESLVENAPEGILRLDCNYRQLYVNQWMVTYTGIARSDFIGKTARETGFPTPLCDRWETAMSTVLNTRCCVEVEFVHQTAGGKRHLCSRFAPDLDAQGEVNGILVFVRDISDAKHREAERKQAEQELQRKAAELQAILDSYPDLYFWTDADGTYQRFHAGSETFVPPEHFLGKRVADVLPTDVAEQFQLAMLQLQQGGKPELEYSLPLPDGIHWYKARLMCLPDGQILTIVREITQRKQYEFLMEKYHQQLEVANAKLQLRSFTDGLTELANRRAFDIRLEEECIRAKRYQTSIALLLLDVDHFKAVNDTLGHPAGDDVLKTIARLCCEKLETVIL